MSLAERFNEFSLRKRLVISGAFVVVVAGITVAVKVAPENPSPAGPRAAGACVDSVRAMREYAAGTRSLASTLSVLRSAEASARSAARTAPRLVPIVRAIVSAQSELTVGDPGPGARLLIDECGSASR